MSLKDYKLSLELNSRVDDDNYYALIMAAMRAADTCNLEKLKEGWPWVWKELRKRYNAPDGLLKGEVMVDERSSIQICADYASKHDGALPTSELRRSRREMLKSLGEGEISV